MSPPSRGGGGFDAATTPIADQIALYRAGRISYGQLGPNARARVNAQDAAAAAAAQQAQAAAAAQEAAQQANALASAQAAAQQAAQAQAAAAAEQAAQQANALAQAQANAAAQAAIRAAAAGPTVSLPPPLTHRPSGIVPTAPAPVVTVFTGRGAPTKPGPPTGAGGATGVVGSKPSHPRSRVPGGATPVAETPEGVALNNSYVAFKTAIAVTLPGIRQQLQHLTHTPIGG